MSGGVPEHQHSEGEAEVVEQGAFVDINVTPLVDIFLVLLVVLMATSTVMLESGTGQQGAGFKVQLPSGSKDQDDATPGGELVIAIPSDGTIIVHNEIVSMAELEQLLANEAKVSKERLVMVQADENALHKRVVEVMEAARKAGLHNLAIATKPE